jgi:chymotrypsin
MRAVCFLLLTLLSFAANAIVVRDDVDDASYRVPASTFPALVDLPGEGHGVLIAPQWVVTAAHAVTWQHAVSQVVIEGVPRAVARVVVHPGYRRPEQALLDHALQTWDWTLFRAALASSDDIALIQLTSAATGVAPVHLSTQADEFGQPVLIFGKGATGQGAAGHGFNDPRRTTLRRAENRITSAHGRWICYVFDAPPAALPLEGGSGSGDSGGPVVARTEAGFRLLGLTAWADPQSTVRIPGRYGQVTCNVRISHYRDWISNVIEGRP